MRAGYLGGLAAWAGFTLPSAIAMTLFAYGEGALKGPAGDGLLHGLKLVAVAIVAQAVLGMARNLAPDRPRATIAILSLILMAFAPAGWAQIAVILLGALGGLIVCRQRRRHRHCRCAAADHPSRRRSFSPASSSPCWRCRSFRRATGAAALAAAFYRSGALVFGGGHVVLPLLRTAVVDPGWVSDNAFLAGYGAAQAMPGPLFTFAAYLGAVGQHSAGRRCRRGAGACCDLRTRTVAVDGRPSVLERLALSEQRAGGDGRRQRGRGGPARLRAL